MHAFVVDCGGDVDTIGAMAGAIWGAVWRQQIAVAATGET
jgi:ADP-ribosylglycohydrolase